MPRVWGLALLHVFPVFGIGRLVHRILWLGLWSSACGWVCLGLV
jgi:hypothetical protein